MTPTINEAMLVGAWLHVPEDDQHGERVFRPRSQHLPPARGRRGYEFHPDGSLTKISSGSTDQTVTSSGRWSADPQGRIYIRVPGEPEEILEVIAQDKDRLVVKK